MSDLVFLTLAAMAVFLVLLVPGNYLISLFWDRDPSNNRFKNHDLMCSVIPKSTTHGAGFVKGRQNTTTNARPFEPLAAA